MNSKAKILAKGSLLRSFGFFLNLIIAFFMMPFVIHSLGDKMYGLWIFVGSFLDFYGLFDLGFASAVQRYVSQAIGKEDYKEANIVINTSLFLFSIIGIVALIFSIAASFSVPFFIRNITEFTLFKRIIFILGLSFAFSFPMKVFNGILTSSLRYDLVTFINISRILLRSFLIIIFLKLGYGVLALAFITLFTDLFSYVLSYLITRSIARYVIFSRVFINTHHIKSLFKYGIFTFINQIADKLRFGIDNFVITIFLGLNFVTLYSIASRFILYFIDLIITAIGILVPVFSQYESKGDYNSIREKFILTTKISSYLSILTGGILLIFGNAFIIRWMGKEYKDAYPILFILVLGVTIALMQAPSVQLVYGISKHKFYAISNSIEGLMNLVLSIILVKNYGLLGVALGTTIPMVIIKLFIQPIYTCKAIKLNMRKYYLKVFVPPILNSSAVLIVLWFLVKNFIATDYLNLLALITFVVILFTLCIAFLGFNSTERNYFKKLVPNV